MTDSKPPPERNLVVLMGLRFIEREDSVEEDCSVHLYKCEAQPAFQLFHYERDEFSPEKWSLRTFGVAAKIERSTLVQLQETLSALKCLIGITP